MTNQQFLQLIRRHRIYILLAMALGGGIEFFIYKKYYDLYEATTILYISGTPGLSNADKENLEVFVQNTTEALVIQQMLLGSNEMVRALIKRFDMYTYYHIDSTTGFAFEKVSKLIGLRTDFLKRSKTDFFEIAFRDKEPAFAIRVVNFMAEKLDKMNRQLMIDRLRKKSSFYKLLLKDVDSDANKIVKKLTEQINSINNVLKNSNPSSSTSEYMVNMQLSLFNLTSEIKSVSQKLVSAGNLYQLNAQSINDDSFPVIRVIEKAIPTEHNPIFQIIFFVFGVAVISLLLYLSVLYFLTVYWGEIKMLFGR